MIVRRQRNGRFTIVANQIAEDDRLSYEAVGLMTYLLSRPDNWRVHVSQLQSRGGCGRDKTRKLIAELIDAGYVTREQARSEDGRQIKGVVYTIYDEPQHAATSQGPENPAPEGQETDCQAPENQGPENPSPYTRRIDNKTDSQQLEREARERADDSGSGGLDGSGAERGEDPRAVERSFKRAFPQWPTYVGDSEEAARKAWFALAPDEREAAVARIADYLAAAKAGGRKTVCAFGKYLTEKRWEKLPPPDAEPAKTHETAAPFGKLWGALRIATLLQPPGAMPAPTAFIQRLIEAGGEAGERERRQHLSRHGWPLVTRMHANAEERRGFTVPIGMAELGELFVQVKVGGELWAAWRRAHEARGWPWLPDPGQLGYVWMPAGADPDEAIRNFEAAVKARETDQAAE